MLKLKTSSLREFFKHSAHIQTNTILPVLANLKLDIKDGICTLMKNSLNSICVGQIEHEGEGQSILIDEKRFSSFLTASSNEFISIAVTDKEVIFTDDKGEGAAQFVPVENYPNAPEYPVDSETFKLTGAHITAIGIASNYINPAETAGPYRFVHLKGENIFAVHNNYFYINGSFTGLPEASFRTEEANVIISYEEIEFMNLERHHIFFTPGYTYIFTKDETQIPNIGPVLGKLVLPGNEFNFATAELVDFIQLANSFSESPIATCSLTPDGMFFKLLLNDINYGSRVQRVISCTGKPDEFTFNSKLIQQAVKAIPYAILNAKTNQNNLIIQNEAEWFCFLGMSKN